MVRFPADVRPAELIKLMESHGFVKDRQSGSHIVMKHPGPPERSVVVPAHRNIKVGTLRGILQSVSEQTRLPIEDLLKKL